MIRKGHWSQIFCWQVRRIVNVDPERVQPFAFETRSDLYRTGVNVDGLAERPGRG